jgi:hypothetical protein
MPKSSKAPSLSTDFFGDSHRMYSFRQTAALADVTVRQFEGSAITLQQRARAYLFEPDIDTGSPVVPARGGRNGPSVIHML